MKIKLKDLKPNPFRQIDHYPFDEARIEKLKTSINNTGFWDNILCRKSNGNYELAYGHHRLEALRRLQKNSFEVDIPCKAISDADMIRIMADENITVYEHDTKVIVETVRVAKEYLEKHIDNIDKIIGAGWPASFKKGMLKRIKVEGVGRSIIESFLGGNWEKGEKITSALNIIKYGYSKIVEEVPTITHANVVADKNLTPRQQEKIVKKIKEGKRGLDGKVRPLTADEAKFEVAKKVAEKTAAKLPKETKEIIITDYELDKFIRRLKKFLDTLSSKELKKIKPQYCDASRIGIIADLLLNIDQKINDLLGGIR